MTQTIACPDADLVSSNVSSPAPRHPDLKRRLILLDVVAAALGWATVLSMAPLVTTGSLELGGRLLWAAGATIVTVLLIGVHNLYLARVCSVRSIELQGLGRSVLGAALALVCAEQVLAIALPLREVWVAATVAFGCLAAGRAGFSAWLRQHRAKGRFVRDLVLVGADGDAVDLAAVAREHPEFGFRVCGYVGAPDLERAIEAPHLGPVDDAVRAVRQTHAAGVVVIASALNPDALNDVVRRLLNEGVNVQLSSGLRGIAQQRFRATPLAYEPLFFIEPASLMTWQLLCKRGIDVVGASLGLIVCAPVLAIAAVAIRLDSSGPILFRQQRVGRDGKLFTFFKLRTMVADAEQHLSRLEPQNLRASGPLFKLATDPRTTRVGHVLRATSLDELPQFWNVLGGSMSLVGPRPALPSEVALFDDRLRNRTSVAPGMTGLWQIEARDNPAFGPYRRLDLFYVENWSPLLDLGILITTFVRVLARAVRAGRDGGFSRPDSIVLD